METKDLNQLTKYYWATDDLLKRISLLETENNDILSGDSKRKLHICKETLLGFRCSIRYRISEIITK